MPDLPLVDDATHLDEPSAQFAALVVSVTGGETDAASVLKTAVAPEECGAGVSASTVSTATLAFWPGAPDHTVSLEGSGLDTSEERMDLGDEPMKDQTSSAQAAVKTDPDSNRPSNGMAVPRKMRVAYSEEDEASLQAMMRRNLAQARGERNEEIEMGRRSNRSAQVIPTLSISEQNNQNRHTKEWQDFIDSLLPWPSLPAAEPGDFQCWVAEDTSVVTGASPAEPGEHVHGDGQRSLSAREAYPFTEEHDPSQRHGHTAHQRQDAMRSIIRPVPQRPRSNISNTARSQHANQYRVSKDSSSIVRASRSRPADTMFEGHGRTMRRHRSTQRTRPPRSSFMMADRKALEEATNSPSDKHEVTANRQAETMASLSQQVGSRGDCAVISDNEGGAEDIVMGE